MQVFSFEQNKLQKNHFLTPSIWIYPSNNWSSARDIPKTAFCKLNVHVHEIHHLPKQHLITLVRKSCLYLLNPMEIHLSHTCTCITDRSIISQTACT